MIVTIIIFLVILSVLVLIHEAGHYFSAKFFGIKVEEFGFGIPPRAFTLFKKGETIYTINWLPIGGFVKLYGEDEAGAGKVSLNDSKPQKTAVEDESRAFYSRPVWQRFTVVFAGVFMNFILAVAIVSVLFSFVGVSVPAKHVLVADVVKGAPAANAGLKTGDVIEKVDGTEVNTPEQLINITKKHLGEEITIQVQTQNKERTVKLTPRKNYPKSQGAMGVAITPNFETKKYPIWEAPFVGTKEVLNQTGLIVQGLYKTVFQIFTQAKIPTDVAGPVGIAQLTGTIVAIGPSAVLSFMALLSLNLAIINVLPIPALDGGRLLFIVIEGLTGKKVSPRAETMAHTIGMAFLLGLIALITLHDILRVISGQPIIPQIK